MAARFNPRMDRAGMLGLVPAGETLSSVAHVSVEQRRRARAYILDEADARYPEEFQAADRAEWLEEMLGILGLREPDELT